MSDENQPLEPLGVVACDSTDCDNNLHCFRQEQRRRVKTDRHGACIECGIELVDWQRVHRRELRDVDYTLEALKLEHVRHFYWCQVTPSEYAINYARRKGRFALPEAVRRRLVSSVGKDKIFRDGIQTKKADSPVANVVHYAQHATASCCRRCIEEWHAIPTGRALTDAEIDYLSQLVLRYIDLKIPDLAEEGIRIPRGARVGNSSRQSASDVSSTT